MSEPGGDSAAAGVVRSLADSQHSAGTMLRLAREAAGLHIGALAVSLKVPVKKLEALESDRLDELPDTVFVRALAASVCKTLKMDAAPVLARLPGHVARPLPVVSASSLAFFSMPTRGWQVPLVARLGRPVIVVVAVLLIATLAMLLAPLLERPNAATRVPAPVPLSGATAPVPVTVVVVPAEVPTSTATVPSATALKAVATTSATAAVAGPPVALPAPVAQLASASVLGTSLVGFRARGPSWVEVTDASGTVMLRKTLVAGETTQASGALPLSVIVGRADVTDVTVRGQSFDMASVSRDNVARFQVK